MPGTSDDPIDVDEQLVSVKTEYHDDGNHSLSVIEGSLQQNHPEPSIEVPLEQHVTIAAPDNQVVPLVKYLEDYQTGEVAEKIETKGCYYYQCAEKLREADVDWEVLAEYMDQGCESFTLVLSELVECQPFVTVHSIRHSKESLDARRLLSVTLM